MSEVPVDPSVGARRRHPSGRTGRPDLLGLAVRVDEMGAERRSRNTDREAAYGPTLDGVAWSHYEAAFEAAGDFQMY